MATERFYENVGAWGKGGIFFHGKMRIYERHEGFRG